MMPNRTTTGFLRTIVGNLLLMVLCTVSGPARALAPLGCWQPSVSAYDDIQCASQSNCVEWILEGGVAAYDCCVGPVIQCGVCATGSQPRPKFTFQEDEFIAMAGKLAFSDVSIEAYEIRHTVPRMPLLIDRVAYSPEDIALFDGVPLHFLMCRSSIEESRLYAFTSKKELFEQVKNCPIGKPSMIVREAPEKAATGIVFYEDEKWSGASYFLPQGHLLDLHETWWNGQVSSLRGVGQGTVVTFYEESKQAGSTLTLATDLGWPGLDAFGWGNRAAAVLVWPVRGVLVPDVK